jgi:hypothetical protein
MLVLLVLFWEMRERGELPSSGPPASIGGGALALLI